MTEYSRKQALAFLKSHGVDLSARTFDRRVSKMMIPYRTLDSGVRRYPVSSLLELVDITKDEIEMDRYLTKEDALRFLERNGLSISISTLDRWRKTKDIGWAEDTSGRIYIKKSSLEELIPNHTSIPIWKKESVIGYLSINENHLPRFIQKQISLQNGKPVYRRDGKYVQASDLVIHRKDGQVAVPKDGDPLNLQTTNIEIISKGEAIQRGRLEGNKRYNQSLLMVDLPPEYLF